MRSGELDSVSGSAREGLHHTTASPDGTVYSVWLDLRARKAQVYGSASFDGGATWKDEQLVYASPDGNVCPCCQPQAAYDARGGLHVMWRNDLDGARDMYLASSKDNGKTFAAAVKLGRDTWPLDACPMDGGGLAGDAEGRVTTVWMRNRSLFRCTPGQPETPLGKGEQGWAAAGPGGVTLVWTVGRMGAVLALPPGAEKPVRLAEHGSDPVVAGAPDGKGPVVAAWEEGHGAARRIRVAVLSPSR